MCQRSVFLVLLLALPVSLSAADPAKVRQKLYVANSGGNDVTVIDVATNKPIGRIEVGPHPHGIAVPASQDVIYVTIEGKSPGELVWIDPATDKVMRRMTIGPAPNQLAVTPDGKFAYVPVSNGYYEVIDLAKAEIIERIHTGGRPHNTVCSADGKHMYLAPMGNPKRVIIVDVATHKPIGEIAFSNVVRPITVSKDEKRLYAEVDGLVGFETADIAERKMIRRTEVELREDQRHVKSRSHGLALSNDGKELWVCDVNHHEVQVFDLTSETPRQIAVIPMSGEVYWITFRPDGKRCYVSGKSEGEVAVVDTATKKVIDRIPVGKVPKRLLIVSVAKRRD